MDLLNRILNVAGLLLICGCGSSGPTILPVKGVLVDGGKAVEGAMIEFAPTNGRPSHGMSDKEGRFSLRYSPDRMGAVPGEHRVRVTVGMAAFDAAVQPSEILKNPPKLEAYELASPILVEQKTSDLRLDLKEMTRPK